MQFGPVTAGTISHPIAPVCSSPASGVLAAAGNPVAPGRIVLAARAAVGQRLVFNKYRELTRKHLPRLFGKLFTELTGLHFHVTWARAVSPRRNGRTLPAGCPLTCRLGGALRSKECQTCRSKNLTRALANNGSGHRFVCGHGVRNFWLPIRLRGEMLGFANLQALAHSAPRHPVRGNSSRCRPSLPEKKATEAMSRLRFARAVRLLHLLVQYLQTSSLADLQHEELGSIRRALWVFGSDQKRLRKKLNGLMPAFRETPPVALLESRSKRIVRAVLDRIHRDYAQPLTLQRCAGDLRVNAAYLSYLFSRLVGLPFKTCLTQVRIEKAREMLSDPARRISEVAGDAGYASENRFRIAFKCATGHSPRVWRETLRMNPQRS